MDLLHITLTIEVSNGKDSYHPYKEKGESKLDFTIPVEALEHLDIGNIALSLIPMAHEDHKTKLLELSQEDDD